MNRTQSELCAAGALSTVLGEEGVSIADALARLSDEEYRIAIAAIELYRKAHRRTPNRTMVEPPCVPPS